MEHLARRGNVQFFQQRFLGVTQAIGFPQALIALDQLSGVEPSKTTPDLLERLSRCNLRPALQQVYFVPRTLVSHLRWEFICGVGSFGSNGGELLA